MRKTEPQSLPVSQLLHSGCSSRMPPSTGPRATAAPTAPAHAPMALPRSCGGNTTVMMASVVGRTAAPPTPMSARKAMSMPGVVANAQAADAMPKMTQADDEDLLAAVLVAEDAPGEQQRREHEDVGVDRPHELALRRLEVALDGRQRDVEDGVVQHHHQQADDQDGEDRPPSRVPLPRRHPCVRLGVHAAPRPCPVRPFRNDTVA